MGDTSKRGQVRQPYPAELDYFKKNPHVSGMAAEDDAVILNPFSKLSDDEKRAVVANETARIHMRHDPNRPEFDLTEDQAKRLGGYSDNPEDVRATIAARIVSGDPSAGEPTPEQLDYVKGLKGRMQLGGTK